MLRRGVRKWRASRTNARAMMPRVLGLLQPARIMVKLKHCFTAQLTMAANDNQSNITTLLPLRMRDVNAAIVTENFPEDFVNYARFYGAYMVNGVKVSAHLIQPSDTPGDNVYSCFYSVPSNTAATPADPYTLITGTAGTNAKNEFLTKKGVRRQYVTGSGVMNTRSRFHKSGYWGTNRIQQLGLTKNLENSSGFVNADGSAAADPGFAPIIVHKLVAPDVGGHSGGGVTYSVRYWITFYCMWYQRRRDLAATIGGGVDV